MNGRFHNIERVLSKEEFDGLLKGKNVIISYIRHAGKNYSLIGVLHKDKEQ